MSNITVWSKPRCVQCTAVKRAFDKAGVEYEEKNLPDSPDVLAKFIEQGFTAAPVVESDMAETFAGFNPALVSDLIAQAKFINGPATAA